MWDFDITQWNNTYWKHAAQCYSALTCPVFNTLTPLRTFTMSDVQPTVQHPFGYHLAQWRFPTVYLIWSFICLIEFSIVTHCDAELIPREPFYDVPWIHTLPPEEYLDTQWTVHEHEFTLTIVMQLLLFNLSFPRIWIRLLPRHLSTSLLFSALLALLCSALHSYTQLHSYTATQLHTATQLYSYTAIQLYSHTATQTDRQTGRPTETGSTEFMD